jgi:hypothetical protein
LPSATAAAGTSSYHPCRGGSTTDGHRGGDVGSFYRGITAHRTSCTKARQVVRGFARNHYDPESGTPDTSRHRTDWRAWSCYSRFHRGGDNPYETVTCRSRLRIVKFYGAP